MIISENIDPLRCRCRPRRVSLSRCLSVDSFSFPLISVDPRVPFCTDIPAVPEQDEAGGERSYILCDPLHEL